MAPPHNQFHPNQTGLCPALRARVKIPFGSSFLLKPAFYWLFSVAGASFGLETFEPGGLTFLWTWPGNP